MAQPNDPSLCWKSPPEYRYVTIYNEPQTCPELAPALE
jgi:hypothetical protein